MVSIVNEVLRNTQSARRQPRHSALFDLGAATVATLARWQQRARERDELAHLDWRELKDIGLTSADVQALIDKPFWRA
jgi:uncharacterized protein YjiS (DUF1127 family)